MLPLVVALLVALPAPAAAQPLPYPVEVRSRAMAFPLAPDRPEPTVEEAVRAAFADAPTMVRVAHCESRFRQFAGSAVLRGEKNPQDVGVLQINEYYHLAAARRLGLDIYTLAGNLAYARLLYDAAGTGPWQASRPCWATP